jgi:hypothetical protein
MNAEPWGPVGALLCNCKATTCKQNFNRFVGIKRLNTPFQILRAGLRSLSCGVSIGAIRFPDEERRREHYNDGIAFEGIARLGVF